MLSIKRIKEILNDQNLSEGEVQEIRDGFYMLAEIIYEKWQKETKTKDSKNAQSPIPLQQYNNKSDIIKLCRK